jgi:hypothetical protein
MMHSDDVDSDGATARSRVASLRTFLPAVVVCVVGVWLTRSFWLPGRYVVGFDTFAYSGPNAEITTTAIRAGRLPLINDTIFGGVTHFGNPQTGVLYPPRLLPLIMDTNRAMGLLVSAHVIFLGLGMKHLLGRLAISPMSSTFGAVALMASGAVMTKTVQFEQILVFAWLPWLLASIHSITFPKAECGKNTRLRSTGVLALVTAAVCSAGHPQLTYQVAVTAVVFWMASMWHAARSAEGSTIRLRSSAPAVASGVVLGVMLVLPQMWAALDATRHSALSGGRDISSLGTADLALTIHRSARAILGTVRSINPGLFVGSFEPISYLGVCLVLLAVVGVVSCIRRPAERNMPAQRTMALAFTALALGSFVIALGPRTFVFRVAFEFLPGFDFARVSARWLVIFTFAMCVLAAFGLDAIKSRIDRRSLVMTSIAIVLGALYVVITTTLPDGVTMTIWVITALVVMALLSMSRASLHPRRFMWALGGIALAEVLIGSMSSIPQHVRSDTSFTQARSDTTHWLARQEGYTIALTPDFGPLPDMVLGLRPNANTLLGIRSIDGYDGGVQITQRWADSLRRFNPNPAVDFPLRSNLVPPIDTHIAARTGIRHLVVDRTRFDSSVTAGWDGPIRREGVLDVYRNPDWRGDALSWPVARTLGRSDLNDVLREGSSSLHDIALVETEISIVPGTCRQQCSVTRWAATRVQPERIEISGSSNVPSLVTYPRQAGSGWRATVDGADATIVPLDALYLGVEVPAGRHTVIFEYRPNWLLPTFVISAIGWAAVLWLMIGNRLTTLRLRRPRRDTSDD